MTKKKDDDETIAVKGTELALSIYPKLHGVNPAIAGVALGDLVSTYFAGHNPELREEAIKIWLEMMLDLIPVNERRMKEQYHSDNPWHRPGGIN